MATEFTQYVNKIIEVIAEKKTDLKYRQIFDFKPGVIHEVPIITVIFDRCLPERINNEQAGYVLSAEIMYYYAKMDAGLKLAELNDRIAFLTQWLLQNQTLNGLVLKTWVDEAGFVEQEAGGTLMASGKILTNSYLYGVNIKDVDT